MYNIIIVLALQTAINDRSIVVLCFHSSRTRTAILAISLQQTTHKMACIWSTEMKSISLCKDMRRREKIHNVLQVIFELVLARRAGVGGDGW